MDRTLKSFENYPVELYKNNEEYITGLCNWVSSKNLYLTDNGFDSTTKINLDDIYKIRRI